MSAPNIHGGVILNHEPGSGRARPPVAATPVGEVARAVATARQAQRAWGAAGARARGAALRRLARVISDREATIADVICRETGKAMFEARVHEVVNIVDLTTWAASRVSRHLADERVHHHLWWPLKRGYVRWEPRGVVGVISPWNYPFLLAMGDLVMALAAGNACVVKPSEWTPSPLALVPGLLADAGIDPDLVPVVQGAGDVGAALVASGVDMVVFTGSVATGRRVAAACGERLIPCIAELGGKDVAIVLADADLDYAARTVVLTAFFNAGQACASAERVLVHESVAEAFTREVLEATRELRVGDPVATWPEQVDVGAITLPHHVTTLEAQVADAVARGARVLAGGHALRIGSGSYFAPTVLTEVPPDAACWREETFGPLLPIRTFTSDDEAVAIANAGPHGLNAYVFSRSVPRAEDVANRIAAGCVIVNDYMWHHGAPEVPWGGWKQSGVGRVHGGRAGLRNFCEPRYVGLPRLGYAPGRFPYDERLLGFYDRAIGRWLLRGPWSRWL